MNQIIYKVLLVFFWIGCAANLLLAQENERLGVKDMTPILSEDLINQNVSIASKSLESIYDAPGVITVITSTEIERFGANNLLEILERVASVYSVGSYFAPNNVLSIRGDLATPYNNHVLILLNGRPTRENLFGGIDYPIYLALPLQAIENIEVIRGPGSVLYGTNAYSGVINIITKDVVEEQTQIGFDYGSFNTYSFQALNTKIKDKLKITSTMRYFGQDGWRHEATGEDGNPLNYDAFQNNLGGMVNVKYNQLNINSFVSYSSQASTGVLPIDNILGVGIRNRSINTVRAFFDVGYNFDLSKKLNISTNATYNSMRTRFSNPSGDFVGSSQDLLLEGTAFYSVLSNLNIVIGSSGYIQSGVAEIGDDVGRGVAPYNKFWYNAYSQLDYSLPFKNKFKMKLTAGAQYNKPSNVNGSFVPRLGLITDFNKNLGLKLLYGQAFRAAFEAENNLRDEPVLVGNPVLLPERVTTFDVQAFYTKGKIQIFATYFNSLQRDLIIQTTQQTPTTYENANTLKLEGVELEFKIAPKPNFFITGSVTRQSNELTNTKDDSKTQNYTLMPQLMAKLGAFYNWKEAGVSMGVFNTYMGKAQDLNVPQNLRNPSPNAYNFLTAKLDINLNKVFKVKVPEDISMTNVMLSIYATNLLDAKVYYPEFVRRNINTLPGRAGRAIYTSLKVSF
jgi:outer membrane receptor protein involved in Fe transport